MTPSPTAPLRGAGTFRWLPATGTAAVLLLSGAAPAASDIAEQGPEILGYEAADSDLTWGVRSSFHRYIRGPIAGGGWETWELNDDDGTFTWSAGTGEVDAAGTSGRISFNGGVRYAGHVGHCEEGEPSLDVQIENPTLEFETVGGATVGTLFVDYSSLPYDASCPEGLQPFSGEQASLVQLEFAEGLEFDGQTLRGTAETALTETGADQVFAGFYTAGSAMDPLSIEIDLSAVEAPTVVDVEAPVQEEDTVLIPEAEGIQYLVNGEPIEAGAFTLTPEVEVTITAEPGEGYEFPEGAETQWTFIHHTPSDGGEEAPEPSLEVVPSADLDPDGETLTVVGEGFDTSATALYPIPGRPAGFYVQIGWIDEVWQPSAGAPSSARANSYSAWVQGAFSQSPYLLWDQNEDGTADFTWEVEIDQETLEETRRDGAELAVFTTGAGGAVQEVNELVVPISFAEPDASPSPVPTEEPTAEPTEPVTPEPTETQEPSETPSASEEPTEVPSPTPSDDPTETGEPTPTEEPSESGTPTEEPTQGPTEAPGVEPSIGDSHLTWGIRESFRNYISGPIANGDWTTWGVEDNDGVLTWSDGQGEVDIENLSGAVSFEGGVHYTGHYSFYIAGEPALSAEFENPTIEFDGETGSLYLDAQSQNLQGEIVGGEQITFAELDFADGLTVEEDTLTGVAEAVLTQDGAEALAGFYDAGEELDSVEFSVSLVEPGEEPTETEEPSPVPTEEPTAEPSETPTVTDEPTAPEEPTAEPTESQTSEPTESSAPTDGPTATGEPTETAVPTEEPGVETSVGESHLTWGIRESFRNYISGPIANGGWSTWGVEDTDGILTWSDGMGEVDLDQLNGSVSFEGGVLYTGHYGYYEQGDPALSVELENPTIEFDGEVGTLYLDAQSQSLQGEVVGGEQIAFAELEFTDGLDIDGDTLTGVAEAVLTEEGSEAFAGFYEAGDELDPVEFSAIVETIVEEPTAEPTESDTPSPTPSEDPTEAEEPTAEASETPTVTDEPTAPEEPTAEPTESSAPTDGPTATGEPTETAVPTEEPTSEPIDDSTPDPAEGPGAERSMEDLTAELEDLIEIPAGQELILGEDVEILVGSWYAQSEVDVILYSEPTELGGAVVVSADGTVSVPMPEDDELAGEHSLAVYQTGGDLLGWVSVTVVVPTDTDTTDEPSAPTQPTAGTTAGAGAPSGSDGEPSDGTTVTADEEPTVDEDPTEDSTTSPAGEPAEGTDDSTDESTGDSPELETAGSGAGTDSGESSPGGSLAATGPGGVVVITVLSVLLLMLGLIVTSARQRRTTEV